MSAASLDIPASDAGVEGQCQGRTRLLLSVLGAVGLATAVAGCASVTSGTTQVIAVNSDPVGADCTLTREGQSLGTVKTPGPVTIKRDSRPVHVSCRMPGYEDGKVVLNSRYETATMGNMILGGAIGMMVDSSTGASNRYDAQVTVPLTLLAGGQVPVPEPVPGAAPTYPSAVPPSAPAAASDGSGYPAPATPASGQSRSRL